MAAYCSAAPLASCTPDTPLQSLLHHFEEFTGLPVLDPATGKPVGVVSEKDVMAYLQQYGDDTKHMATPVRCAVMRCDAPWGALTRPRRHIMSAPAVTVRHDARVAYAAGLMLQQCVAQRACAAAQPLTSPGPRMCVAACR